MKYKNIISFICWIIICSIGVTNGNNILIDFLFIFISTNIIYFIVTYKKPGVEEEKLIIDDVKGQWD